MRVAEFVLVSTILLLRDIVVAVPAAVMATSPLTLSTQSYAFANSPGVMRFNRTYGVRSPLYTTANLTYGLNAQTSPKIGTATALRSSKKSDNNFDGLAEELVNGQRAAKDVQDPNVSESGVKEVHDKVALLLLRKMQGWMDGGRRNLDSIKKYLGFPRETINLINVAITKLHSAYRNGLMDIARLLVAYYYSCDIEHAHDFSDGGDGDDVVTVSKTFQIFLSSFGYTEADMRGINEAALTVELRKIVNGVAVPVSPVYSVTIDLMKNRMFEGPTAKKSVSKLAERYANDVKSREKETDGIQVTENHLQVIGKLIPDIFGLAYNHLELFTELKKYELDDRADKEAISRFSGFLRSFMNVFMIRYFEFKGTHDKVEAEFLEAIYPLIDFMDPEKAPEDPKYSILNYRDHDDAEYEKHMRNLMDNALEKLLAVFGNENVEEWGKNRTLIVDYPEGKLTKEILVELMNSNTKDSFDVLGTFVENFAQGLELYDKHLFSTSQWPADEEFRPINFILM